jgi:hypothetical protein
MMLHKAVPQAPLHDLLLLQEASYDDEPTCDDMHVLWNNDSIQELN